MSNTLWSNNYYSVVILKGLQVGFKLQGPGIEFPQGYQVQVECMPM